MSYCARNGNQPLPVLWDMTRVDLMRFHKAISDIVGDENKTGSDG